MIEDVEGNEAGVIGRGGGGEAGVIVDSKVVLETEHGQASLLPPRLALHLSPDRKQRQPAKRSRSSESVWRERKRGKMEGSEERRHGSEAARSEH